jgi:propionyl-CoA carboxylase beta chain
MTMNDPYHETMETLDRLREESIAAGGRDKKEHQHSLGRLTARERIDLLLDDDSFEEFDVLKRGRGGMAGDEPSYAGDGVVTGHGTIDGMESGVASQMDGVIADINVSAGQAVEVGDILVVFEK